MYPGEVKILQSYNDPIELKLQCKSFNAKYHFENNELESVEYVYDLGILLHQRLSFRQQISVLKKWSMEFSDPLVTKQLYFSIVRNLLEYYVM